MINDKGIFIKNIYYMLTYAFQVLRQQNYEKIASEEFEYIQKLYPNESFVTDNYSRNEGLIALSEKGITDLNNIIKSLKLELQETKEIQAKMTNEKVKDTQTILLLKEGKDNSEQILKENGLFKAILTTDTAEYFYEAHGYYKDKAYVAKNEDELFVKLL